MFYVQCLMAHTGVLAGIRDTVLKLFLGCKFMLWQNHDIILNIKKLFSLAVMRW
jgi:hypothetical protein